MTKVNLSKIVKVPVVMQMEALECGAACLCMILEYYNKWLPLEQVRKDCGVSRDGSNAANIAKAANTYGLDVKAHRYSVESMKTKVLYPAIIHWNFNHFVVLCGFKKDKAIINDPARGTVIVSAKEFDRSFTGICLEFEPGTEFERGGSKQSVLRFVKARLHKSVIPILFIMLTSALAAAVGLITPAFERIFTDHILTGANKEWSSCFFLIVFITAIFRLIVGSINEIYFYKIKGKMAITSNASFMWHILHLPLEFFSQRMSGDLALRQKLNDSIANTLISKIAPVLIQIALLVFYFITMIRYSPLLTLVGCTAILINIIITQIASKKRIQTTRIRMREEGNLISATVSGIDMIETIKAAGAENGFFERWAGFQAAANTTAAKEIKNDCIFDNLPVLVKNLSNAAILIIGVWMIMKGKFSTGMLVAFQSLIIQFIAPVESLIGLGTNIQQMKTSMERVEDVMKYPEESLPEVQKKADTEYDKLSGTIELKHVTFGYSRLAPPLLKDFNLTIHPGDKVAFVGSSGCGKSTIAKLIAGLYQPWEGEILYDGKPFSEIEKEVFSGSLSVVNQDIALFEGTVSENIKMWDKTIEDYEMILAARDAQIHEDIMSRLGGYSDQIDANGKNFSGGQRQRIEIARVLAGDPTIAILDEATSALDAKTEYAVMKAVQDRGITCIVVAHRLSTIRDCSEIVVLERGVVVERGTHEELYALGKKYAQLITME